MPKKFIKPISLLLCFCFFFTQTGLAQLLPQPLLVPLQLPVLRYLSVNTANPSNYFNFLLDRGQRTEDGGQRIELNQEAKKLIHYFFLGITLPSEAFWVNLKPQEPERITSEELAKTDLGRTLLEQDLKLKKDMAKYLHPHNPQGKLYWEKLYQALEHEGRKASATNRGGPAKNNGWKKATITSSNRVWIVPAEAVVLETEDGALVARAQLKVLLESEYLSLKEKRWNKEVEAKSEVRDEIKHISESLMKEIILPALTKEINESPGYAPLRQVYHSLILAEWYKRKHNQRTEDRSQKTEDGKTEKLKNEGTSPYASYINSGTTTGLESELPWEKQAIWQEYLKSYQEGEYNLQDTIFGLKRMYFSGGMEFTNIPIVSSPLTSSSAIKPPDNTVPVVNIRGNNNIAGNSNVISLPKEIQEAPVLSDTSSISKPIQEAGASKKTEIAASPIKENKRSFRTWAKGAILAGSLVSLLAVMSGDALRNSHTVQQAQPVQQEKNSIVALQSAASKGDQNALQELIKQAKQENIDAFESLEAVVSRGNQTVLQKLIEWAEQGNSDAIACLGFVTSKAAGYQTVLQKLIEWAEQGNRDAIESLKIMEYGGDQSALQELIKLAEQGNIDAIEPRILSSSTQSADDQARKQILSVLDVTPFLEQAKREKGQKKINSVVIILDALVRNWGNLRAERALRTMDPQLFIEEAKQQQEDMSWMLLLRYGNQQALKESINLGKEGNNNAVTRSLYRISEESVLELRQAHLVGRVSDAELAKRLTEKSFNNNPFLLYAFYISPENFGDLAKMIIGRLEAQAQAKGEGIVPFLKNLDPKGVFWKDFILQTANFSQLDRLLSSAQSLPLVLDTLFKNISQKDILDYALRMALFTETILEDKVFVYQKDFQVYLRSLYDQAPSAFHRRLPAALVSVYRDKMNYIAQDDITTIIRKEGIQEQFKTPIAYDEIFKDGRLVVHIVFADKDAVQGHRDRTKAFFQQRGFEEAPSEDKNQTVLEKGAVRIVLFIADKNEYNINQHLANADVIISRSHAGGENRVFKEQGDPYPAKSKLFLLSACRSATIMGVLVRHYPGALFIGVNEIARGDQTNELLESYLNIFSSKKIKTFEAARDSIRKNGPQSFNNFVLPGDRAQKVHQIIQGSLNQSLSAGSPAVEESGSASTERSRSASSAVTTMQRQRFAFKEEDDDKTVFFAHGMRLLELSLEGIKATLENVKKFGLLSSEELDKQGFKPNSSWDKEYRDLVHGVVINPKIGPIEDLGNGLLRISTDAGYATIKGSRDMTFSEIQKAILEQALYGKMTSGAAILPVLAERSDEAYEDFARISESQVEKRLENSVIFLVDFNKLKIGQVYSQLEVGVEGVIDLKDIKYILVPAQIYPIAREVFKEEEIKVVSIETKVEKELPIIRKTLIPAHPEVGINNPFEYTGLKETALAMPDYEKELLTIISSQAKFQYSLKDNFSQLIVALNDMLLPKFDIYNYLQPNPLMNRAVELYENRDNFLPIFKNTFLKTTVMLPLLVPPVFKLEDLARLDWAQLTNPIKIIENEGKGITFIKDIKLIPLIKELGINEEDIKRVKKTFSAALENERNAYRATTADLEHPVTRGAIYRNALRYAAKELGIEPTELAEQLLPVVKDSEKRILEDFLKVNSGITPGSPAVQSASTEQASGSEARRSASSALSNSKLTDEIASPRDSVGARNDDTKGGIDLSQIELTLKDDKYISSLNPADIKILRAAKALKEEWNSLSLLYIHELILLLKDNLASEIQNKNLLSQVLRQLQSQKFLDLQAIQFLNFIQANKPLSEVKLAMYQ